MPQPEIIALVTGAGRETGLGFETAAQLGARGVHVVLTARNPADAAARAATLAARGLSVEGAGLDVTRPEEVKALAARLDRQFGRLDILVNNAAAVTGAGEAPSAASLDHARQSLETILIGAWATAQAFLPLLRKSAHGRIVNVTSGAGSHADSGFGLTTGNGMGPAYGVAKAALNALTALQAVEEKSNGVLVNAVCPGFTATFEGGESMGARPVRDGAAGIVWAAMLPKDGPTGGFFRDGKPIGW